MSVVTCTESATENVSNIYTWHTGNPPKPGEYVVLYKESILFGVEAETDNWLGDQWRYCDELSGHKVVAWAFLPSDL